MACAVIGVIAAASIHISETSMQLGVTLASGPSIAAFSRVPTSPKSATGLTKPLNQPDL
jgi:hypothetical protein